MPKASVREHAQNTSSMLSVTLAFVFGVVFLATLLTLTVAIPNPTEQQFQIFRIVIAIAAGGVAAVIPGLLDIRMDTGRRLVLRAGGALAVFVIVYFFSPARWVGETPVTHSVQLNRTEGAQSPVISGNSGPVIYSSDPTSRRPAVRSVPSEPR
jgi:hypothetical protein